MKAYKHTSIKNWSVEDRPREKLLKTGIQTLSNAELVAILIGSGTKQLSAVDVARNILSEVENDLHNLGKLQVDELTRIKGIGKAKAITLLSALELGSRKQSGVPGELIQISNSRTAYDILYPIIGELEHEEFWILILNRAHKVLKAQKISQGGLTGTVIDTRMIMKYAIDKKATSLIISHNHPSGNKAPSDADIRITQKIFDGGKIMDVRVLDHIVVAGKDYFSFADEGIMPL